MARTHSTIAPRLGPAPHAGSRSRPASWRVSAAGQAVPGTWRGRCSRSIRPPTRGGVPPVLRIIRVLRSQSCSLFVHAGARCPLLSCVRRVLRPIDKREVVPFRAGGFARKGGCAAVLVGEVSLCQARAMGGARETPEAAAARRDDARRGQAQGRQQRRGGAMGPAWTAGAAAGRGERGGEGVDGGADAVAGRAGRRRHRRGAAELRRDEPAVDTVEKGLKAAKAAGVPVDLERGRSRRRRRWR